MIFINYNQINTCRDNNNIIVNIFISNNPGMASKKHLFDEYKDLSSVCTPLKATKLEGAITQLLPMKSGNLPFFDGRLCVQSS